MFTMMLFCVILFPSLIVMRRLSTNSILTVLEFILRVFGYAHGVHLASILGGGMEKVLPIIPVYLISFYSVAPSFSNQFRR